MVILVLPGTQLTHELLPSRERHPPVEFVLVGAMTSLDLAIRLGAAGRDVLGAPADIDHDRAEQWVVAALCGAPSVFRAAPNADAPRKSGSICLRRRRARRKATPPCPRGPPRRSLAPSHRTVEERPMRRAGKRVKAKDGANLPVAKRSRNNQSSRVRDLEQRLAEAQEREAEALGQLQTRSRDLAEMQEQQTATGEILRVISSSPSDVQPAFDVIVRSAVRLCSGEFSCVVRFDGELMHFVAQHNFRPDALTVVRQWFPRRPDADRLVGPVILEARIMNVPDVTTEFRFVPGQREQGYRSSLFVPMLRDGESIGAIGVSRREAG